MGGANLPKWDASHDYRAGLKAYELAQEFKVELGPRVPAGLLEGLHEDLNTLSAAGDQRQTKIAEVKGFTGGEKQAREKAAALASSIRESLRRAKAPASVLKSTGVGTKFQATSVEGATASLTTVVDAYEKNPDPFREAGVLPEDMDAARALLAALSAADRNQETAKIKKTQTTVQRNALRMRVEAAVDRIRGVGILHFRDQPATAARFAALVPGGGNGGGGSTEEDPKPPATPKA